MARQRLIRRSTSFFLAPRSHRLRHGGTTAQSTASAPVFGFRDFTRQAALDSQLPRRPRSEASPEHLKALTATRTGPALPRTTPPRLRCRPFQRCGPDTEIVPYSVLINKPAFDPRRSLRRQRHKDPHRPNAEHVGPAANGTVDHFQDDPRILARVQQLLALPPMSPPRSSTPTMAVSQDFQRLAELGVSLKGKIVLVRYGGNVPRRQGLPRAALRSHRRPHLLRPRRRRLRQSGPAYPDGPARPDSGVQRGSVQFLPIYPGDPTTPGVASVPTLPASERIPGRPAAVRHPQHPANPLSAADAAPILRALGGASRAAEWQGGGPLRYRLGGARRAITVHMRLVQDARLRTDLGRHRQHSRRYPPGRVGRRRKPSRRLGLRRHRPRQRHGRDARRRFTAWACC